MEHIILKLIHKDTKPTQYDDLTKNFLIGQPWFNIKDNTYYICISNEVNNARWNKLTCNISPQENYRIGHSSLLGNNNTKIIKTDLDFSIDYVSVTPLQNTFDTLGNIYVNIKNDIIEIKNSGSFNGNICWFVSGKIEKKCILSIHIINFGIIKDEFNSIECSESMEYHLDKNTNIMLNYENVDGYVFENWEISDDNIDPHNFILEKDITIAAVFKPKIYTIKVNKVGLGTVLDDHNKLLCGYLCENNYNCNDVVTLTAIPYDGFRVDSWIGVDSFNDETATVLMTDNKIIEVVFEYDNIDNFLEKKQYTLTINNSNIGGNIASEDDNIDCGNVCSYKYDEYALINLTAIPNMNYVFSGWTGDIETQNSEISFIIDKDIVLNSNFSPMQYKLNIDIIGDGYIDGDISCNQSSSFYFDYNETLNILAVSNIGNKFKKFNGDITSSDPNISINVKSDLNIVCYFELEKYNVNIYNNDLGTINICNEITCSESVCSNLFNYGDIIFLNTVLEEGQIFDSWTVDTNTFMSELLIVYIDKNIDITVNFDIIKYLLTITNNGNGQIQVNDEMIECDDSCQSTHEYNTDIVLEAIPDDGYSFLKWEYDGQEDTNNPLLVNMLSNKDIMVTFTELLYKLSVNVINNGTIKSDDTFIDCPDINCEQFYSINEIISLTPTPNTGFIFKEWENYYNVTHHNIATVELSQDITINGVFMEKPSIVNHGYVCGGHVGASPSDKIEKFIFPLDSGNTTADYKLTTEKRDISSNNSTSHMYIYGGNKIFDVGLDSIEKYSFINESDSYISTTLSVNKSRTSANNSLNYGYIYGGMQNETEYILDNIEKISFSNDSEPASISASISVEKNMTTANNSSNYGYICGGWISNGNIQSDIEKFMFYLDNPNSHTCDNLTEEKCGSSANNSSNYGYIYGGTYYNADSTHVYKDSIDRFTFPIDNANTILVNALNEDISFSAANNSSNYGYICGGSNIWDLNSINRLTYSLDSGTITEVSILTENKFRLTASDGTDFTNLFI